MKNEEAKGKKTKGNTRRQIWINEIVREIGKGTKAGRTKN